MGSCRRASISASNSRSGSQHGAIHLSGDGPAGGCARYRRCELAAQPLPALPHLAFSARGAMKHPGKPAKIAPRWWRRRKSSPPRKEATGQISMLAAGKLGALAVALLALVAVSGVDGGAVPIAALNATTPINVAAFATQSNGVATINASELRQFLNRGLIVLRRNSRTAVKTNVTRRHGNRTIELELYRKVSHGNTPDPWKGHARVAPWRL